MGAGGGRRRAVGVRDEPPGGAQTGHFIPDDVLFGLQISDVGIDEWGAHYIRGYVGSVACAAGVARASVFGRLRVTEAVFSKHYSRPPVASVALRLARRKRKWDLSEIPFV